MAKISGRKESAIGTILSFITGNFTTALRVKKPGMFCANYSARACL